MQKQMLGVIHNYCHAEIKDGAPNCRRQQAGISMDEVYSGSVAETSKHGRNKETQLRERGTSTDDSAKA